MHLACSAFTPFSVVPRFGCGVALFGSDHFNNYIIDDRNSTITYIGPYWTRNLSLAINSQSRIDDSQLFDGTV
jgi:hypothetical protein